MTRRRSKSATLHEVAALAGCSIKTVSRVVNGEDYVSPETAARVLDAVKKLGYVPNLSARRLATRRTHVIAVVFDNASWNWLNDFQRGAFDRAAEFGYETIVHPCDITSAADRDRVVRLLVAVRRHAAGASAGGFRLPPESRHPPGPGRKQRLPSGGAAVPDQISMVILPKCLPVSW